MKNVSIISIFGAGFLCFSLAMTASAGEDAIAALTKEAKVSEAQARKTALAKVPNGAVKSSELEREHGVLVWSFDLTEPSVNWVTEVQVDAKSGRIVSVKKESVAQEANEAKAERTLK